MAMKVKGKGWRVCPVCGKEFYRKPSDIKRMKHGVITCSRTCCNKYRKIWMSGNNNHQYGLRGSNNSSFKGDRISKKNNRVKEIMIYAPEHPYGVHGRVTLHRLLVERNYKLFNSSCFEEVNGVIVLKKGYCVHHKDGNHNNNSIENLEIVTKGQHRRIHNAKNPQPKDPITGRYIKRI